VYTRKFGTYIESGILILLGILVWGVLWILLSGSFMATDEMITRVGPVLLPSTEQASFRIIPTYLSAKAYVELLIDSPDFYVMFWNSCIQVFSILFGQLFVATPAAWAFARFRFPGQRFLFIVYMILMVMPFQVTMVSSYFVLNKLHLLDTHLAIILPSTFSTLSVFIMTKFFKAIPIEIVEAAKIDGASESYIFLNIGIPLGFPGIMSVMVLSFLENWNAIEQPLTFLKNKELWPLSLYLPNIVSSRASIAFVASVIMCLPSLLIFVAGQAYLEQGITASGLKE
jgi:multiple sugar transport system permease protein